MSKRSAWCLPSKEETKIIRERDKHKCIWCGNKKSLTNAHIFVSSAKGGRGCKENIVTGCVECHYFAVDNPIGKTKVEKSHVMMEYAKKYLIEKEHISFSKEFLCTLRFKKPTEYKPEPIITIPKNENVCLDCLYIKKNKNNYNSLNSYFCSSKRQVVTKRKEACDGFLHKEPNR